MEPPAPQAGGVAVDRIEIRLPSRADFLGAVRSVVRGVLEECLQVRVPEEEIQRIQIALQEACINVVRHAHGNQAGKPLVVSIVARPDLLQLEIEDSGPGLPPRDRRPPDPDPENPREGGYGLFIMQQTMDEVRSERRGDRHVLVLVKRLGAMERREPAGAGG